MAPQPGIYQHKPYATLLEAQADATLLDRMWCFIAGVAHRKIDGSIFPIGTFIGTLGGFPPTGDPATLYIDNATKQFYLWGGVSYLPMFTYGDVTVFNPGDAEDLTTLHQTAPFFDIVNNGYYSGGWRYKKAGEATRIKIDKDGAIRFQHAEAGLSNAIITQWDDAILFTKDGIAPVIARNDGSWTEDSEVSGFSAKVGKYPDNTLHIQLQIATTGAFTGTLLLSATGNPFELNANTNHQFDFKNALGTKVHSGSIHYDSVSENTEITVLTSFSGGEIFEALVVKPIIFT